MWFCASSGGLAGEIGAGARGFFGWKVKDSKKDRLKIV